MRRIGGRTVLAPANTAVQRIEGRSRLRLGHLQPLTFAVRRCYWHTVCWTKLDSKLWRSHDPDQGYYHP
ncbi:MAG: hypothetical protein JOZ78_26625 [Chroococcidiopsidaceae cyanobacterium CP_BM_ER_R8_30]|nr:hypothetical protein [Chroococcidiopsidaceae cyanobacterium CP_BM_ER_R8_30]